MVRKADTYDVRVFMVDQTAAMPQELSPATMHARSPEEARLLVRRRFETEGYKVRCVSIMLDRAGRAAIACYLQGAPR